METEKFVHENWARIPIFLKQAMMENTRASDFFRATCEVRTWEKVNFGTYVYGRKAYFDHRNTPLKYCVTPCIYTYLAKILFNWIICLFVLQMLKSSFYLKEEKHLPTVLDSPLSACIFQVL